MYRPRRGRCKKSDIAIEVALLEDGILAGQVGGRESDIAQPDDEVKQEKRIQIFKEYTHQGLQYIIVAITLNG